MTHSVVIVPDLLTVPEEATTDLKLPALENILSRAKLSKTDDRCVEQSLMRHFGYSMPSPTSIPAGRIRWTADFDEPAPEYCVCADPVHMLADIDHARLMDAASLKLSKAESVHYINALNKVFADDGLEFVYGAPDRWYLAGQDASMLGTLPVKTLVGRNVASFLPEGDSSAHWRTLTTEVQMVLFSDNMNQTRESQGQLALNALWIWGGGNYEKPIADSPDRCYSNDVFCQGLAALNQTPISALSDSDLESITDDYVLFMDGAGMNAIIYENYTEWQNWITAMEEELFKPLWRALKSGKINSLTLNVGNGCEYRVTASRFPTFWRRRKSIRSHFSKSSLELKG